MTTFDIKTFEFAPGMSLRTTIRDGLPWFVAKDVCDALGYVNGRDAIAKHVDDEEKNSVAIRDGIRGNPVRVVINESGLYSLILSSNKPEAKAFRKWVTGTVLPSLRTGGVYVVGQEKVDLASMSYDAAQVHIEALKAKVAEAEAIRWAMSRQDRADYREAMRFLGRRSYSTPAGSGRKSARKVKA